MQPNKRTIHEFVFRTDGYFKIPDFQRPYTWDTYQTDMFLDDLEKTSISQNSHYFGTIVLIKENDHSVIIDGQQRLTTTLLFLTACYHLLIKDPEKSSIYTADTLKDLFLVNTYSSNLHDKNRITLRTVTTDNQVLDKIFNGENLSLTEKANKLFKTYSRFYTYLSLKDNIDYLIESLKKFEIVEIKLDNTDDNPQLIFENINSTGEPLSAGDKIRNWALMLNNKNSREIVYNDYWRIIENKLTRVEKDKQVDYISDFFKTYLMCKNSVFISDANTYRLFKEMLEKNVNVNDLDSIKVFYNDVIKFLKPYLFIKFLEYDNNLDIFRDKIFALKFLQTEIINTFLITLLVDYTDNKLTKDEVNNSLELIETFLIRRILFGIKNEGLNVRFPDLHNIIRSKQRENSAKTYDDCLACWMIEGKGRTIYLPTDTDISNTLKTLNFYSNKTYQQQFILAKLCDVSKESNLLNSISEKKLNLSIEHIMPQTLTPKWQKELGDDWESIHNRWLHTLSNLTLTAYNSKYSNLPFNDKKVIENGFNSSPLLINKYIATFNIWNEDSLEKRSDWLLENIKSIWKYPITSIDINHSILDQEILSPYEWEVETFKKPIFLIIDSNKYSVTSWTDLYIKVIQFIANNFEFKFNHLIDNQALYGIADRPLITMNKNIPHQVHKLDNNIYIEKQLGVDSIMQNIIKICEFIDYNASNCPIQFIVEDK